MLKRTTLNSINNILSKNSNWKILDVGCGYRANKFATVISDVQDLSGYYNNRNFIRVSSKELPFKNKEFDFVIASHVIEHVEDFEFFIKELERVSNKGYIELPTRLGDNIVFENKSDHIWWFKFNDHEDKIIASKKKQFIDPFITVSMAKLLEKMFRESLVMELYWENTINYEFDIKLEKENFEKISFFKIIRKFFSKKIRTFLRKK
ncbi:MAG: Ubiquinone/menaquinone biosynthesis C-methylase UbiE [Pelagibacterales bacterium]|nr:Ubiquinone/menaquinone biosynthesis C-methylase UbiE [Pelagibacterales bacterium]